MATATRKRDYFYVRYERMRNGKPLADRVSGSAEAAKESILGRDDKVKVARVPFVPLESDRRFFACAIPWEPPYRKELGELSIDERVAIYRRESDAMPKPQNCLDLPPAIDVGGYEFWHQEKWQTRDEAFAEVSENNRSIGRRDWMGVIEIGCPMPSSIMVLDIDSTGIGRFGVETLYPVRVVRPTKAEIERFKGVQR